LEDLPRFGYRSDDGSQAIFREYDIRSIASRIGTAFNSDADVGLP